MPLQCVGTWTMDKHDYLARYIEATAGARGKFVTATPTRSRIGGAAFVDLFAGPGRARTRGGKIVDGSPLIAAQHSKAPFTRVVLCELDPDNLRALRARTSEFGDRIRILEGDCNERIDDALSLVPDQGLNIAFYDPFAPRAFKWETLRKLGQKTRMDLLIHFPTMGVKRNFGAVDIDSMVGRDDWRESVTSAADTVHLFQYLRRSLSDIGYVDEGVRSLPVKNNKGGIVYHLIYATKNTLGNKIWKSITSIEAGGQRSLF